MNRSNLLAFLPLLLLAGCAADATEDAPLESDESEFSSSGDRSDYTRIDAKSCSVKIDDSEPMITSTSDCAGRGGFSLRVLDGDERQSVSLVKAGVETELNNLEATDFGFTYLPTARVEWRSARLNPDNPFALIFRQQQYIDENNRPEMLVVTKLTGKTPCIYSVIDARKHSNANQLAREAGNESIVGTCPKEVPHAK